MGNDQIFLQLLREVQAEQAKHTEMLERCTAQLNAMSGQLDQIGALFDRAEAALRACERNLDRLR